VIDFHCHLELYRDPVAEAERLALSKIDVLSVGTTPSAFLGTRNMALGSTNIRTALGFHPHLAAQRMFELETFDRLLSETPYVGEVGLDGAPEHLKTSNQQMKVFRHILSGCTAIGGRVISIHSRRAADEVISELEENRGSGTPIFHWFSGNQRELDRAIELGAWFSVGPAMLRGKRGRELTARMPKERVLTETDGPFAMVQGRALLPGEVGDAYIGLAQIWNCELGEVATRIRSNLSVLENSVSQFETCVSQPERKLILERNVTYSPKSSAPNPNHHYHDLQNGDELDCAQFPMVRRKGLN
jgi:TatD DNase family protein